MKRAAAVKAAEQLKTKKKGKPEGTAETPPPLPYPTPSTSGRPHPNTASGPGTSASGGDSLSGDEFNQSHYQSADENDDEEEVNMANFEDQDGTDAAGANVEARSIKLDFDRKDVRAWLTRLEIRLEFAGVQSQWLKRLCLENMLPQDIANCCNDYFSKPKTSADALIYKLCKQRILQTYGPKPGEDFKKALKFVMTGRPSEAAKEIRDLVCLKPTKLTGCCCGVQVGVLWREILPAPCKAAVAGMDMTTQFDDIIKKADDIYDAVVAPGANPVPVAAVKPAKKSTTVTASATPTAATGAVPKTNLTPADLDTSADVSAFDQINQLTTQIAALNKNFKKQNKRGGRGATNSQNRGGARNTTRGRGPPHPDGPPEEACYYHWRFGRAAYSCGDTQKCPWANLTK